MEDYARTESPVLAKHQVTPFETAVGLLKQSHIEVTSLIESFSDEALITRKHFSWTGTTTLGSYCISATSSHYDWAIKEIKKPVKAVI